jgi:hypothetical protein
MKKRTDFRVKLRRIYLVAIAAFLMSVGAAPYFMRGHASAYGQIANRSVAISSAVPGKTNVTYTFTFTPASTTQVEYMKFIACNPPAVFAYPGNTTNCVAPTGLSFSGATYNTQTNWQGAGTFAVDNTGANDCIPAVNVLCANRTDVTGQTLTSRTISFSTITNPTTNNFSFYIGVYTYSGLTGSYKTADFLDFGATATAVTQSLTTNAAVAEVLQFCVGSTTVDDVDTTQPTNLIASDCSGVSGTTVDIGTLDTSGINISPVTTDGGNSNNGVAMVRSNAGNGVAISYDAIQASTGTNHLGTLRISGQTCNTIGDPGADANGNTFTDPCINSAGWNSGTGNATQTTLTAGTELFGMTIAGINSNGTSSYACQYGDTNATPTIAAGNSCHLEPQSNYFGKGGSGTEDYCTSCNTVDSGNGYAWDEDGSATTIASSAGATVKQVDDEALLLKFAATPEITTPFGRYAVQTDFIAVPTY